MLTNTYTIPVVKAGAVAVANGIGTFVLPKDADLVAVTAYAATAPTGATLIANVAKNGTKIFSGAARPTIAISANAATTVATAKDANAGVNVITPTVNPIVALATFVAGDVVRVDVDQIGSTVAGSDLTVVLEFKSK